MGSQDREVQRILLELLNQMDGFDQSTNVKVGGQRQFVGTPAPYFGSLLLSPRCLSVVSLSFLSREEAPLAAYCVCKRFYDKPHRAKMCLYASYFGS